MNLPALQVTLDELLFHTQQIAQGRGIPLGEVSVKIDPYVRIRFCCIFFYVRVMVYVGPLHSTGWRGLHRARTHTYTHPTTQHPHPHTYNTPTFIDIYIIHPHLQTSRIVGSMPRIMHASRARKLGLPQDSTVEEIIEGCVRVYLFGLLLGWWVGPVCVVRAAPSFASPPTD